MCVELAEVEDAKKSFNCSLGAEFQFELWLRWKGGEDQDICGVGYALSKSHPASVFIYSANADLNHDQKLQRWISRTQPRTRPRTSDRRRPTSHLYAVVMEMGVVVVLVVVWSLGEKRACPELDGSGCGGGSTRSCSSCDGRSRSFNHDVRDEFARRALRSGFAATLRSVVFKGIT